MSINISLKEEDSNLRPQITVIGVGGAGGNAVNNMIRSNLEGVEFLIANTDAQALEHSSCERKIQLGLKSTKGLGAGMRPDIGRLAAEETLEEIKEKLINSHMIFIAAGMGGGTGTGAAPVIAKLARENGILTVGVVTKPFHFEGNRRMTLADEGIEDLQQHVDTLLTIPNQNLFRIANENTTFADAFKMADDVLYAGVRGVTDLMVQPGLINLDFSDIKTVMSEMGKAMMGTGEAEGEGRAVAAAEAAIANPLIDDVSLRGAKGLIINITGGKDITLYEVDEAANRIKQEVEDNSNIIYGTTCDDRLEGVLRVSIVATGIDNDIILSENNTQKSKVLSINNSVYQQESSTIENVAVNTSNLSQEKIEDRSSEVSEPSNISLDDDLIDSNEHQLTNSFNKNDTTEGNNYNYEESQSQESVIEENQINLDSLNNLESDEKNHDKEIEKSEPKSSVRRLSLFDTINEGDIENSNSEASQNNSTKTEPILDKHDNSDNEILQEADSDEITHESDLSEDDFNQEPEEELLDIPTFLRRQAN